MFLPSTPLAVPPVLILRHGETEWNRAGRMQGHGDSPLTPRGRAQARAQGAILVARGVGPASHDAYASPLGRVRETAALALAPTGLVPRPEPRLREIGCGAWEGRTRDEIAVARDAFPSSMAWYDAAPGGEGVAALVARLEAFLATLGRPAVLVTHGVATRMMRCLLLGVAAEALTPAPEGGQGWVLSIANGREAWIGPENSPSGATGFIDTPPPGT